MKKVNFSKLLILILILSLLLVGSASALTWSSAAGCWTATNATHKWVMWNATGTTSYKIETGVTSLRILTIGGGGSAGSGTGGGGGGGGFNETISFSVTAGSSYPVVVGSGGNASIAANTAGKPGTNSSFSTVRSLLGGFGGGGNTNGLPDWVIWKGGNGANGGGGAADTGVAGIGWEGYNGGSAGGYNNGGGGGGCGGPGQKGPSNNNGGVGGLGLNSTITGEVVGYCGGGGGAGATTGGTTNTTYGGANASSSASYDTGYPRPNSGGGSGGGLVSRNGADGIVIIVFASGAGDTTPPDSINGLTDTKVNCTAIQWNWTNPNSTDYSHLYTLKNNFWMANYTNTSIGVVWAGLTGGTVYNFSSRTVDLSGNMNATWVNKSETTDACPTPTPTAAPTPLAVGAQWCGVQTLYFGNSSAVNATGYKDLSNVPSGYTEVNGSVTVKAADGPKLIDSFITPENLPNTLLELPGLRYAHIYAYVDTHTGDTYLNYSFYRHMVNGTEIYQFSIISPEITALTVTEYENEHVNPQNLTFAYTDREVIKIFANTSSAAERTVYFVYEGIAHASHIQSGFFECPVASCACTIPITPAPTMGMPYLPAAPAGSWIKDWVMKNAWWLIIVIIGYLVLTWRK